MDEFINEPDGTISLKSDNNSSPSFPFPEHTEEDMQQMHLLYYEHLKKSPNNFSFWFPRIKDCGIPIPESVIIPVPIEIMDCLFLEREGDEETLKAFVREKVMPAIPASFGKKVFLKNGCFSNKFQFGQCHPDNNLESLFESITCINQDSFAFDTGGNTEIVIRRFIGETDTDFTESIYQGMRLRPEIRVFYDFENKRPLYTANYWDKDYCNEAICRHEADAEVYHKIYPVLKDIYAREKDNVLALVHKAMQNVNLKAIWSVDLMYAESKWWLIDMAIGPMSAYWDEEKVKKAITQLP